LLEVLVGPRRMKRYRRKLALAAFYSGASLMKQELRRAAAAGAVAVTGGVVFLVA
jgi:hypothetical protein